MKITKTEGTTNKGESKTTWQIDISLWPAGIVFVILLVFIASLVYAVSTGDWSGWVE